MIARTSYSTPQEVNLNKLLNKAIESVHGELKGLCISCVKYGTSTGQDGNCRAELECQSSAKTEQETG